MLFFVSAAVAALFMISWKVWPLTSLLWWVSGSLGIGMGFHRLLTHRGYKTPKAVEYFLTFCGSLALEGGAINWVVTHRIHHAHTDALATRIHRATVAGGRTWVGFCAALHSNMNPRSMQRYAPDLMKDPVHVWMNRLYFVPLILVRNCAAGFRWLGNALRRRFCA